MSPRRHALACAIVLALPLLARASDDDASPTSKPDRRTALDTVVVTGTKSDSPFGEKTGIPLSRMPQSVQVIEAAQLRDLDAQSIGDALRDVPSANPGNSRVARYQSFSLKVRGFLADQMRNGIRQRYYEDIDASAISNIDRIEVLKGPSSVLFGQSAIGGILSIVTKRPTDAFAGSVALTVGEDDRKVGEFDIGGPLNATGTLGARLTGEVERSDTFVDYQDMRRQNAGFTLTWEPSDRARMTLVTEYVDRETLGNPGLPVIGTVMGNGVRRLDRSLYLGEPTAGGLTADAPLVQWWTDFRLNDTWTLTPRYQYQEFNSAFTQIRVRAMGADGVTLSRNGRFGEEDDAYQIAQLDLNGEFATGAVEHHLLAGIEFDRERSTFHQENLTNVAPINVLAPVYFYRDNAPQAVFAFDLVGDIDGTALYLQDRLSFTPDFDLLLGARHSKFDNHAVFNDDVDDLSTSATTAQVGGNWRFATDWSLFGGYNSGIDVESSLGTRAADGSPLKPERSEQLEAGVRYAGDTARASLAAFEVKRKDALTTDPVNPDFSVQTGEQRVRGIELEGQWQPTDTLTFNGGLAWMKGEVTKSNDGDEGDELGDTPRHTFTARVTHEFTPNWQWRAGFYAVDSRLLTQGNAIRVPGYALVNLAVGYRAKDWSVDVYLDNAFDRTYYTATGTTFSVYPGDPRQIGVRATWQW